MKNRMIFSAIGLMLSLSVLLLAPLAQAEVADAPLSPGQHIQDIMTANNKKMYTGSNCYVQVEHFNDAGMTYIILTTELGWAFLPYQEFATTVSAPVSWSIENNSLKATASKNHSLYIFAYDPATLQLTHAFLHVPGKTNINCEALKETANN